MSGLGFKGKWSQRLSLGSFILTWGFWGFWRNGGKGLPVPVGIYLSLGCPDDSYTQEASKFVKSWQVDIDVGSQFNSYQTHHEDGPYLGIRMNDTWNDGSTERHWFMHYNCLHYGGWVSPYIISGAGLDFGMSARPPLRWLFSFSVGKSVMNLPTMIELDPSLPRVLLLRKDQELASQHVDYVDHIYPIIRGRDNLNAVQVIKQLK